MSHTVKRSDGPGAATGPVRYLLPLVQVEVRELDIRKRVKISSFAKCFEIDFWLKIKGKRPNTQNI